jgi:acyl-CoA thioesterase-1
MGPLSRRRVLFGVAGLALFGCRQGSVRPEPDSTGGSGDEGGEDAALPVADGRGPDDGREDARSGALVYVSLGDSFTAGTGSLPEQSFPSRLLARWSAAGVRVTLRNPAVNGNTTADVLSRQVPSLGWQRPSLVTLAIGANNIVRSGTDASYRADVRRIVWAAREAGVSASNLVGIPQPEWPRSPTGALFGSPAQSLARVRDFNVILREEIERMNGAWAALESLMSAQADRAMWAPDGLHPSADAYDQWAEALFRERPAVLRPG